MEPPLDAIQIACRTLDVRMFEVPVDARQAEALQTSLKQILTAETLGSSKLQSLECGSVICKLELRAESEADVNASVENLSGQLGKNFPTAAYYRTASGERAIYVGTAAADLGVDPDQEGP
jgi:hypothetical protein